MRQNEIQLSLPSLIMAAYWHCEVPHLTFGFLWWLRQHISTNTHTFWVGGWRHREVSPSFFPFFLWLYLLKLIDLMASWILDSGFDNTTNSLDSGLWTSLFLSFVFSFALPFLGPSGSPFLFVVGTGSVGIRAIVGLEGFSSRRDFVERPFELSKIGFLP